MKLDNKKLFEEKIRPIFTYVGFIGAIVMSFAYIITVFVLILGFDKQHSFKSSLLFAAINAVIGLIILQFLKYQGQAFAQSLDENKKILELYYDKQAKEKKLKSIKQYWIKSVIVDTIVKGFTMLLSTCGIIYIVIKGSNDWNMLLLAIVNLIMFICFGMVSLVKTYDFYNNSYIPFLKEEIKILEDKKCQENTISKMQSDTSQNTITQVEDSTSINSRKTQTTKTIGSLVNYMPLAPKEITNSTISMITTQPYTLVNFSEANQDYKVFQEQTD